MFILGFLLFNFSTFVWLAPPGIVVVVGHKRIEDVRRGRSSKRGWRLQQGWGEGGGGGNDDDGRSCVVVKF